MKKLFKYWTFADDCYGDKATRIKGYEVYLIKLGNDVLKVYENDLEIIFAFRGSDDVKDWINNLQQGLFDKVHEGFSKSAIRFRPFLKKILGLDGAKQVYFVGHSRGAALATLGAYYCAKVQKLPCSCFAYESPRIGRSDFKDEYNRLPIYHTTVRNGWDIVTCLPTYIQGFRHVGKMIELDQPFYHRLMYWRVKDHLRENVEKAILKHKSED